MTASTGAPMANRGHRACDCPQTQSAASRAQAGSEQCGNVRRQASLRFLHMAVYIHHDIAMACTHVLLPLLLSPPLAAIHTHDLPTFQSCICATVSRTLLLYNTGGACGTTSQCIKPPRTHVLRVFKPLKTYTQAKHLRLPPTPPCDCLSLHLGVHSQTNTSATRGTVPVP